MPKLTVEFSERIAELLGGIAARNSISKVDVLRRAVALYGLVDQQVAGVLPEGSRQLAIVDQDDKVLVKVVLP